MAVGKGSLNRAAKAMQNQPSGIAFEKSDQEEVKVVEVPEVIKEPVSISVEKPVAEAVENKKIERGPKLAEKPEIAIKESKPVKEKQKEKEKQVVKPKAVEKVDVKTEERQNVNDAANTKDKVSKVNKQQKRTMIISVGDNMPIHLM